MNQNIFNHKFTTSVEVKTNPFIVDFVFTTLNEEISFGQNGKNFDEWFGGLILPPSPRVVVESWNLQKPADEISFINETGGCVRPVSLSSVYSLLKARQQDFIGNLAIFFCHSPRTQNIHLLALFCKNSLWHIRGYGESVRESRNWRPEGKFLVEKPLL